MCSSIRGLTPVARHLELSERLCGERVRASQSIFTAAIMPLFWVAAAITLVKTPIGILAEHHVVLVFRAHFIDQRGQFGELRVIDASSRERAQLRLRWNAAPRAIERADIGHARLAAGRLGVHDIHAGADANSSYQAIQLQRDDGFANGRARHREGLRQLALRGQTLTDFVFAARNAGRQLLSDALVQSLCVGRHFRQRGQPMVLDGAIIAGLTNCHKPAPRQIQLNGRW